MVKEIEKLSQEDLLDLCKNNPEAAADIITALLPLVEKVQVLEAHIKELERQIDSNSKNSHRPPGSEPFRKPKSERKRGGRNGGQPGHKGTRLEIVQKPDEIVTHQVCECSECRHELNTTTPTHVIKRQVFDLPTPRIIVTEHQGEVKICPVCGKKTIAEFPHGVDAPTQYGDNIKSMVVYLNTQQLLPLERVTELIEAWTGHRISEATILHHIEQMQHAVKPCEQEIREQLLNSSVLNADESGLRVNGKLHWLHVVSNESYTYYSVHAKRGFAAIEDIGLLTEYDGVLVSDCYASYFNKAITALHALCNAHITRELQGVWDYDRLKWARDMKEFLLAVWDDTKERRGRNTPATTDEIVAIVHRMRDILLDGERENVSLTFPRSKRTKRPAKHKAVNLWERIFYNHENILCFVVDDNVPFTNNQAEQDIRMIRVKSKISGTFRTTQGATAFASIRSVISSLRKQNRNVFASLAQILAGEFSFLPQGS